MKKSKILERFLYFTRVLRFLKPNQVSDDYMLVFFQREPPVSDDSVACISGSYGRGSELRSWTKFRAKGSIIVVADETGDLLYLGRG
ncbi:hypothetical protein C5167_020793 [Papaver somniferum]|uniref:Uncharacterized protein n=1 Tax=Papaver somniferum TaxID=3469 RepID=A0A4Y7IY03_PAPSO|nr:hypothetical protein C5167_020793 [Papaver somniferum]